PLMTSTDGTGSDVYSLQVNTNPVPGTSVAACGSSSTCLGWEQFIFDSYDRVAIIQYWLLKYNATCPGGWMQSASPPDINCYQTVLAAVAVPTPGPSMPDPIAITNLANLSLSASFIGNTDIATILIGGTAYSTAYGTNLVNLKANWTQTEFNVYGDGWNTGA